MSSGCGHGRVWYDVMGCVHIPNKPITKFDPGVITDQGELESFCRELDREERFALDTEFVLEDTYDAHVCLVQVATPTRTLLIDAVAPLDLAALWTRVADANIEVVVHAGMEDLHICRTAIGREPQSIFDVQLAAGLVGLNYPMSLSRLVWDVLGVRLTKSQTLTDWRRRPLSADQKRYAVEDVAYLLRIHEVLSQRLDQMNRRSWAAEEFAKLTSHQPQRDNQAKLSRIKGSGALDRQGLAILRELVTVRAELAGRQNRPVRKVVRDDLLVEIARHKWKKASQISTLRGLPHQDRRELAQALADGAERAARLPAAEHPELPARKDESPEELLVADLISAFIRSCCICEQIALPIFATKRDIRAFASDWCKGRLAKSTSLLCHGWRRKVIYDDLVGFLDGKTGLRFGGRPLGLRVSEAQDGGQA